MSRDNGSAELVRSSGQSTTVKGFIIAVMWLFASMLTIFFAIIFFTNLIGGSADAVARLLGDNGGSIFALVLLLAFIALPMCAAAWLTFVILQEYED